MMEQANFAIKPNVTKICLFNTLKVFLVAAVIVVLGIYLTKLVGDMSIIADTFEITQEDMPKSSELLFAFGLGVIAVSVLSYVLTLFSVSKVQYIFYPDKLEIFKDSMFLSMKRSELTYNNILSVRATESTQDSIMRTGSIILELTGTEQKEEVISYVDKAKEYLPYIQQRLDQWKAQSNMEYQENAEISQTLNRI